MGSFSTTMIRPGIRPGMGMPFAPIGSTSFQQLSSNVRYQRYPMAPGNLNIRRPYNPNFSNQMVLNNHRKNFLDQFSYMMRHLNLAPST